MMQEDKYTNRPEKPDSSNEAQQVGLSAVERFVMPGDAFALQPVRFMPSNELRYYTATTFPNNPRGGCGMYYQRCRVAGGIFLTYAKRIKVFK